MNPLDQKKAGNTEDDDGGIIIETRDLLSRGSVPKLMKNSAGGERCCIFRIPRGREKKKKDYYAPSVVSIGPYHHGEEHLQMIEEHKHRFLKLFMDEARKKDVEMNDLIEAVSPLVEDIMDSYSENLDLAAGFDRNKLIDMMVLDGCFILMLFFVMTKRVPYTRSDDPIFKMRWILPAIMKDLLLLENQVPFFLLQTIFDKSKIVTSCGLNKITVEFFSCLGSLGYPDTEPKHLLDLIRKTLVPRKPSKENKDSVYRPFLKLIPSAKDLQLQGIEFIARKREVLLDVEHKMGTSSVGIPPIVLDDFLISVFRNCVVFEQFYGDCTYLVTSYIAFMGCLIRNEADANLLTEKGIIENSFGMGGDISEIFKDMGKDIQQHFDVHESCLAEVFEGINEYISHKFRAQWSFVRHTYFSGDPWALQSLFIGILVLDLTIIQVYLAVYQFVKDKK